MKTKRLLKFIGLFSISFLVCTFFISYVIYKCHNDSLSRKVLRFNNKLSAKHPIARSEVLCIMSPEGEHHYVYYTEKGEFYENIVDRIIDGTHILKVVDLDGCTLNARYTQDVLERYGLCPICRIATVFVRTGVSVGYDRMIRFLRGLRLSADMAVFFFVDDYDVVIRVIADRKEIKRCVVRIGTYRGSRMALRTCLYLFHRCINLDREYLSE
ncbi:hypothetical protein THOM_2358 [Trachipleistophora hominis]|uniref:Uncharacterized protein n=1 Tax=Trachipleistophora hominis TaxID=72359 RepID=L7JVG2_TRAHO|nr:hypothetical protein THOM_2358 [Trachipleistophora hominis]